MVVNRKLSLDRKQTHSSQHNATKRAKPFKRIAHEYFATLQLKQANCLFGNLVCVYVAARKTNILAGATKKSTFAVWKANS